MSAPLLEARDLVKTFGAPGGLAPRLGLRRFGRADRAIRAVDRVGLTVGTGECLALVGESGSGKTTLGRCILRLLEPDAGSVRFDGEDLLALGSRELRRRRRRFQMVFQDPHEALDPRMRVGRIVAEPLETHRIGTASERHQRVADLLSLVGLDPGVTDRYPHQFSGGERQRIGIARALASEPDLLVADEPVAALDLLVRAQVIHLLRDLQRRLGLAIVFIAHDLALVRHLAHRVMVLRAGKVVEEAETERIFTRPEHPYTRALLEAIPRLRPDLRGHPAAPPGGDT